MYTLGKFKTEDVFTMSKLLSKIGIGQFVNAFGRENVLEIINSIGEKDNKNLPTLAGMGIALQIAEVILGNVDKCKKELYLLLTNISGLSDDEIKDMDAEAFMGLIVDVVQLPQFKDFIKVVSKLFK